VKLTIYICIYSLIPVQLLKHLACLHNWQVAKAVTKLYLPYNWQLYTAVETSETKSFSAAVGEHI
jgi:hypothetical protein